MGVGMLAEQPLAVFQITFVSPFIVSFSFFHIGKHFISFHDFLKLFHVCFTVFHNIGMIFFHKVTIGLFDITLAGGNPDAQNLIVISHTFPPFLHACFCLYYIAFRGK